MKKQITVAILALVLTLAFAIPASAMGNGNVKGEITEINADQITLLTNKGEVLVVTAPLDFDTSTLAVGDNILVRGTSTGEGTVDATTIKLVDADDDKDEEETESEEIEGEDDGEGGLAEHSAFCAEDKQEKQHPLAVSIAADYGLVEEDVMTLFCEGHSFGAIMLALITGEIQGLDYNEVLASRAAGQGWGQIWKGLGLIGNPEAGTSPPGLLKRPEHAGQGKPENPGNPNN